MRLLVWVLLLVVLISHACAESTIPDTTEIAESKLTPSDMNNLTRLLVDGYNSADNAEKQYLRGSSKFNSRPNDQDQDGRDVDEEERGLIPASIENFFRRIKAAWNSHFSHVRASWTKWKEDSLIRAFENMEKTGETPYLLAKRLKIYGEGAMESRYMKLFKKYTAWYDARHAAKDIA